MQLLITYPEIYFKHLQAKTKTSVNLIKFYPTSILFNNYYECPNLDIPIH